MANFDIYSAITERIIAELEQGIIPWLKPWTGTSNGPIKHTTGKPYSLLNQFLLGKPGEYITYRQAQAEGGQVRKGEHGKIVVFWKFLQTEKRDENNAIVRDESGMPVAKIVPILKYYTVFHIDQCEGVKPKWEKPEELHDVQPVEKAQTVLDGYLTRESIKLVNEKGDRAFYRPATDEIHLPLMEQFEDAAGYYDTAFHEATHSTGHPKRLNRISLDSSTAAFGSEDYSKEELVAEIGACGIMHQLGIETEKTFRNNAAYIQSWLKALRNDKKMIVAASGKAEQAIAMILGNSAPEADAE